MSKAKKEFPEGRSDKKMSKKKAHKQRVAMCLNTVKESSIKSLIGDMTFTDFLITEALADRKKTYTLATVFKANPLFKELFGSFVSDNVRDEKTGRKRVISMTDSTVVDKMVREFRAEIENDYPDIDFDRIRPEDIQTLTPEIEAFVDEKDAQINTNGANIYKDDPTTAIDAADQEAEDEYLGQQGEMNKERFGTKRKQRDSIDMKLRNDAEMKAARDEVAAMRANPDDEKFVRMNQAKAKVDTMKKQGVAPGKQSASGVLYRIKKTGWFQAMDPSQQEQVVANIRSGMSGAEAKAAVTG